MAKKIVWRINNAIPRILDLSSLLFTLD